MQRNTSTACIPRSLCCNLPLWLLIATQPRSIVCLRDRVNKNGTPGRTNRCVWVSCLHPKMLLTCYCYSSRILIDQKLRNKNQLSLQLSTTNTRVVRKIVELESNIVFWSDFHWENGLSNLGVRFQTQQKMTKEAPRQLFSGAVPGNFFGGFIRCVFVCFKVEWCFSKIAFYYEQVQKLLDILIKMIQIFHMNKPQFLWCFLVARWFFHLGKGWEHGEVSSLFTSWIHGFMDPNLHSERPVHLEPTAVFAWFGE